jgi:hypothetical protein
LVFEGFCLEDRKAKDQNPKDTRDKRRDKRQEESLEKRRRRRRDLRIETPKGQKKAKPSKEEAFLF